MNEQQRTYTTSEPRYLSDLFAPIRKIYPPCTMSKTPAEKWEHIKNPSSRKSHSHITPRSEYFVSRELKELGARREKHSDRYRGSELVQV